MHAVLGKHAIDPSHLIADADRVFSGYFRGQGIDALVVGTLSGIVLTAIGVPYGPVIGLLTGLGNLIPYVGGPVGYLSLVLVCLADGTTGKLIVGIVALTLIMLVDANVINPRLLSQNVEVHPLLVVAALIAGSAIGGIVGMLAAVPVVAFIKVKVDSWIERREMDGAVQDAGAEE
jgi:predicted PurR-regulated permease PerM